MNYLKTVVFTYTLRVRDRTVSKSLILICCCLHIHFLSSSSSASICFYLYVSWNCVCCLHCFFKLQQTSSNFLIEVKIPNLDWIAKTYFKYGFIKVNKNWTKTTSTINIFILLKISCVQTYKIRTKSNLFLLQIHVPCRYTPLCSKHYSIVSFCL